MKKLLNVTLAVALVFQSFLGTGMVQASTTDEVIQVEEVMEVENLNEPVLEDIVEQEPIVVKDEVMNESEVTEDIEIPPKEEHREVESESTDVLEENEVVEDATLEENQLVADEVLLDDVEQEVEYGGEDYVIITSDRISPHATAVVKEAYRIPNTAYNLTSIKPKWWTLRGMPKLTAEAWGTVYTAFCVEPGLMHENAGNMDSTDINGYDALTWNQKDKINQIMMYGYGNNGDYSDDSYVATQVAIWEVVTNHPSWGTIWGQLIQKHANRDRIYNEIWKNVDKHNIRPSFMNDDKWNPKEAILKWNGSTYTTTLTDDNGVLSKYNVISNNGDVQVSQNGNQLTLTTTNPNADVTLRLSKQGTTGGNTLYWVSGKQDVVTGGQDDPVHAYLKIKVESVGNVNLIKKSVTGEVIPNTQFRVVGNGVDTTVTTGANGEILVPNLVAGTYEITEVSVPSPYVLDNTPKIVEIKPNETATVEFINDVAKGRVEVLKLAQTITGFNVLENVIEWVIEDLPLADVTFNVYAREDISKSDGSVAFKTNDYVGTFTTGDDGKANLGDLPLGKYFATEVKAPSGIYIEDIEYDFEFTYEDMNTPIVMSSFDVMNQRQFIKVNLTKVGEQRDGSYDVLSGVTFGLFNKEDIELSNGVILPANTLIQTQFTNELGELTFETVLPIGTFYVQELAVDEQYVLSDEKFEFTYDGTIQDQATLEIEINNGEVISNELVRGGFELTKKSETGDVLEGVEFTLFSQFKENLGTFVTDKNGKIAVDNLIYGDYMLLETKSANGHQLLKEPIFFSIRKNKEVVELTAVNKLTVTEILKVDENGNPLVGATLQILDLDGNVIDEWISTDKPHQYLGLKHQKYLLNEVAAPSGYRLMDKPIEFEVTDSTETLVLQAVNQPTRVEINKYDPSGNKLFGAIMQIIDKETGEILHEWRTTDETKVFEKLPHKTLILREITAPDGFQKILDIEFTITDENKVHVFEITDELTLTTIHKVDPYGNQIEGARLGVYKIENGEEIFITEFVTGKDSTDLKGLKPDQYVLRELEEPKGYLKAKDVYFTVTDAHEVVHVTMVDEFDRTVPTTGLNDLLPMIAGVGLVSVGTILYVKRKRHN